jgi:ankyrin repeat protein
VVEVLVAAGLPVDALDEYDNTALDEAAGDARLDVMRALVAAGANLERRGRHIGETALHRLCRSFSVDAAAVEAMIALGADLFAIDSSGGTALHHAAQLFIGDRHDLLAPVITVLVRAGLPVDTRNRVGQTALFDAVGEEGGEVGAVRALLEHGADPNATDHRGYTPLMIAVCGCYQADQVVPILIAGGADPKIRAHDDKNAVDFARNQLGTWQSICAGDDGTDLDRTTRRREAAAEADLIFDLVSRAAR